MIPRQGTRLCSVRGDDPKPSPLVLISCIATQPAENAEQGRATGPAADWRATFTAECGLYAARRLHRRVWVPPERAPAATDQREIEAARDALPLPAIERRWVPRPTS